MILRPFFLMLSIASFSLSANEVVQGPFEFSPGNFVSVEKGNSTSDVLDLIVKINNKNSRIDSYEHNGSPPSIETIFFKKSEEIKISLFLFRGRCYIEPKESMQTYIKCMDILTKMGLLNKIH